MIAISIGHDVEGVPTHTHTHVLEVFAGLMPAYGIDGYSAYEMAGCYLGEREASTRVELFDDVQDLGGLLCELCDALEQREIYACEYAEARFVAGHRAAA